MEKEKQIFGKQMSAGLCGDTGTQRDLTDFIRFLPVYTLISHYSFIYGDNSLPEKGLLSTFCKAVRGKVRVRQEGGKAQPLKE